jgi:hypothetical protein
MRRAMFGLAAAALLAVGTASATANAQRTPHADPAPLAATPVVVWSNEARRAIVPAGPGGIFGAENYGNKFPGEAAIYLGIVHAAIYDAAVALEGGYQPYAVSVTAPANTAPEAAIATAAHHTLIGLQPQLGLNPAQQAILDADYLSYMDAIPDGTRAPSRSRARCRAKGRSGGRRRVGAAPVRRR